MPEEDNQLLDGETLSVWGPEFELKLDVLINSWSVDLGDFGSIFSFSADEFLRVPALWTPPGSDNELYLVTCTNYCGELFKDELGIFKPEVWYHFEISQRKHLVKYFKHIF